MIDSIKSIYDLSADPFISVILGMIVFFAGKPAKSVGVVIIILGIIYLVLSYFTLWRKEGMTFEVCNIPLGLYCRGNCYD